MSFQMKKAAPRRTGCAARRHEALGSCDCCLNFDVDRREPSGDVGRQASRARHHCCQNSKQNQRVFEQILTRLFLMELAKELCERHAVISFVRFEIAYTCPRAKILAQETRHPVNARTLIGDYY